MNTSIAGSESMCLDTFIGTNGLCNNWASSILSIRIQSIDCTALWPVQCIRSSMLVNPIVLHNFCLCAKLWRSNQSLSIASNLANHLQNGICHVLSTPSSDIINSGIHKISAILQRTDILSRHDWEYRFDHSRRDTNNTCFRFANRYD